MRTTAAFLQATLVTVAAGLAVGGCAAPAVQYYTLAGAPRMAAAASATGAANSGAVHVEVAPVGVPERLARPQMVIRNDGDGDGDRRNGSRTGGDDDVDSSRVQVLEQQRWTSPFDSELRDAFAGAIAARAGAVDVTRGGRLPGQPVYRVAIRVRHLDAILDRQVDAGFGWTITRSDDSRSALCQVTVSLPVGAGMNELVQGIEQAVAVAAGRIAAQIAQLQRGGSAMCEPTVPAGAARIK